ncbi:MAG: DUF1987 domain-containing protein [Flavobacteriales bacterium]|nr:DUF1987 domain-containing protein [Flavobacteriales bacterium]
MERFEIEGDGKKPEVALNGEKGLIEISGRSIPEHAGKFYMPILDWIDRYVKSPAEETTIRFELEYYNSSSKRYLLDVLERFSLLHENGHKVTLNWYYEEDDEDAEDVGTMFKELIKFETNLIPVPEEV